MALTGDIPLHLGVLNRADAQMPVAANEELAVVTEKDKGTTGREMNLRTLKRLAPVKLDLLRQLALEGLMNRGVGNLAVVEGRCPRWR